MKELEVAKKTALEAGKLAMTYYKRNDLKVEDKGGFWQNYLTEVDKACEELISKELTHQFPEHGFIGEETFDNKKVNKEFVWIVDPIDGTKGFVNQTDNFAVHIGLARNGEAVLGVVYLPVYKKLFWAVKGKGAFLNGKRTYVSRRNTLKTMNMLTSTRALHDKELKELTGKIPCKNKIAVDSAGVKAVAVAEGKNDITVFKSRGSAEWDICAPAIIVEEAGGRVTDLNNKSLKFNTGKSYPHKGILITNNQIHEEIIEMVK
ncbi:MAG: inositol monophosphatase family protein [archaeon]